MREYIAKTLAGADLSVSEAEAAMGTIMAGEATPAQIAGLLVALRAKGETIEEITGFARAMRQAAVPVKTSRRPLVDTCGTGGDHSGTFNVSTTAAFVTAGAGVAVAKHGNRAASSRCGSADVLEHLGLNIALGPEDVGRCIDEVGIGFLFAPQLHPAMKHAVAPRKELGVRTVFNLLGPLTNPAGADRQVLGVFEGAFVTTMAKVLARLGAARAFVVHGEDGLDEITTTAVTKVAEVANGEVDLYQVAPEQFGVARARREDLLGGDVTRNSEMLLRVLEGAPGPPTDIVLVNAAAAVVVGGLAEALDEGLALARESIASGAARQKLTDLIRFSGRSK